MIGGDIVVTENVSTAIKAFGMTFRKSAAYRAAFNMVPS